MNRTSMTIIPAMGAAAAAVILAAACAGKEKTGEAASPAPQGETLTSGEYTMTLPLGLQAGSAFIPEDNPLSESKIALGKKLYFDARLSADNTISCATCHAPDKGFSDGRPTSAGIRSQTGNRNAPTVINRLFSAEQFWDGRAATLEEQALGPIQNPIEMGHTLPGMIAHLNGIAGYKDEFQKVFGTAEITPDLVAKAIASYERTVLAGNSAFDRYAAGDKTAMSESAVRGMEIFNDKDRGNCVTCHAGFNFTDESYHNLGVGMDRPQPDLGRYTVTKAEADKGAFKTPTLRNIAETGPYMHDGSEVNLRAVVEFYDRGGNPNPQLSKEIRRLNLSERDKQDLVAFLEALTGEVTNADPPAALP
jgi:cytochrome c peroxidase